MSDTPRTDALLLGEDDPVLAHHARQLERESDDRLALYHESQRQKVELQDRIGQLMRDAERYRYLRGKVTCQHADSWSDAQELRLPTFFEPKGVTFLRGSICEHLDAAIDAALLPQLPRP